MALTYGSGPLGPAAGGRLAGVRQVGTVRYAEPLPYRLRAIIGEAAILDSERAFLLYESGRLPVAYVPREDIAEGAGPLVEAPVDAPLPAGLVTIPWAAAERWLCEDAEQVGHLADPYHRIDVFPTSRHVVVSVEGVVLAASTGALLVVEAALPRRLYLPPADVHDALLVESATHTTCAYKGVASYRSARLPGGRELVDVAWSYPAPSAAMAALRDRWAFFDELVDVDLDGVRQERPRSPWTR